MRPLLARERRTLLRWSLLTCMAVLLLAPLATSRSFEAQADAPPSVPRIDPPRVPERLVYPPIVVTHDPFAAAPGTPAEGVAGAAVAETVPVVRAVIVGDSPRALVDVGDRTVIVAVGSALAGSVVAGIDARGLRLRDGRTLPLAEKGL